MLQGHFIDLTLDINSVSNDNSLYNGWLGIRGLTAPLFFFVSGLIFCYVFLIAESKNKGSERLKKGYFRGVKLLFLGYLLQTKFRDLPLYLNGEINPWVFGFHVLQCIGMCILILNSIFLIHHLLKRRTNSLVLVSIGFISFLLYTWLNQTYFNTYFPQNAHPIVQNMFKGQYSMFSLLKFLPFILFGAALGNFLFNNLTENRFQLFRKLFIIAGLSYFAPWLLLKCIDLTYFFPETEWVLDAGILARTGQAIGVIAIMLLAEPYLMRYLKSWIDIGQYTLPIYFIHVVMLYGGIIGFGIKSFWNKNLTPWESILGALGFIALFYSLSKLIALYYSKWHTKLLTRPSQNN